MRKTFECFPGEMADSQRRGMKFFLSAVGAEFFLPGISAVLAGCHDVSR
jgi:hypothetical protein